MAKFVSVKLEERVCSARGIPHREHTWHLDVSTTEYYQCPGIEIMPDQEMEKLRARKTV